MNNPFKPKKYKPEGPSDAEIAAQKAAEAEIAAEKAKQLEEAKKLQQAENMEATAKARGRRGRRALLEQGANYMTLLG